jgi:hypothetical protein
MLLSRPRPHPDMEPVPVHLNTHVPAIKNLGEPTGIGG